MVVARVAVAADPHFRVEQRHIIIDVKADGTSRTETYDVMSLLTDTSIDWYGEDSLYFNADSQQAEVLGAFTELPDSTRIAVEDKAIRLTAADSPDEGSYSDSKAYTVIFPQLVTGARICARWLANTRCCTQAR